MNWTFPFLNLLQPGILFPALADYRPMFVVSIVFLLVAWARRTGVARSDDFLSAGFVALSGFVAVQVISVHGGGMKVMFNELLFWLTYVLYVIVSLMLITSISALRRYVLGMIAGGMFVVGYGIYAIPAHLGLAGETGRAGAYGMYQNHNDYSFIIVQIVPFIYMYSTIESGWRRLLLRLCLVTCVVGMFLSLSRGGVLALVLEFLLIVMLGMRGRARLWLLPIVALLGVSAITYQWVKRAENQQTGYTAETARESREELWRAARKIVEARPLLGVGSRRFGEAARNYYPLSKNQIGKNAHNTYLEVLATSGFIGFSLFLYMLYRVWKELRQRVAANAPPILEATRIAALVAFYSILFRATLDAKSEDWCVYVLVALGIAYSALRRALAAHGEDDVASSPLVEPTLAMRKGVLIRDSARSRISHDVFKG